MTDFEHQEHLNFLERHYKLNNAKNLGNTKVMTPSQDYLFSAFEKNYWHLRLKILSPQQVMDNLLHVCLETKLYLDSKYNRKSRESVLKNLSKEIWERFDAYCDYMDEQELMNHE